MVNNEITHRMNIIVKKQLTNIINRAVESLKEIIISSYDSALSGVKIPLGSRIDLNDIKASLVDQLNEFNYISSNGTIDISVPDMETFDFSKNPNLRLLQTILEGVVGVYVLVNGNEFVSVYGHKPINEETLDESFAPADMLYLIPYSPKVQSVEAKLKTKFTKYPFSNMPPVRLFEDGEDYVKVNIEKWIDTSLKMAEKEFINSYKGAN